jgi:hypothetical protein
MAIILFLSTPPDAPSNTNILIFIIIALAGGLSILFVLLIAVVVIAICIFVRRKKKPQREPDRLYDTIDIGHPPPVVETELNIAYRHPEKKLK